MNLSQFEGYKTGSLKSFAEKLQEVYYNELGVFCNDAKKQVLKLDELEKHVTPSHYVIQCTSLVKEIQNYINQRTEHLIPYLLELHDKGAGDHDCSKCSGTGGCSVKHELQLVELAQSHRDFKFILRRLQMVALPLYAETLFPDDYRILRNQMALLENGLTELFMFEDAFLIPKIKEAQKNINAHH